LERCRYCGKHLTISHGSRHELDGTGITRRDPNANSVRPVQVPARLIRILVANRKKVVAESLAAGRPAPDLAFPTSSGTMPDRRNLDRWLDRVAGKAKVEVKGSHDFRHTLATASGEDGTPLTRTAAALGHRKVDTTGRVYTHPTAAADAAVPRGQRLLTSKVEAE
jgi:integrase